MDIRIRSTRGQQLFTFVGDPLVGEVVTKAAQAFGFERLNRYGLLLSCNAIAPLRYDRTLSSYGIDNGSTLFFTIMSRDM